MKEKPKIKIDILIIAIIASLLVAIGLSLAKYIFTDSNEVLLQFYEYRISQDDINIFNKDNIFLSTNDYTKDEVTVEITTEEPGLSIQYKLGNSEVWNDYDYTEKIIVTENTKLETRLVAKDSEGNLTFNGPITEKDITNISVAKIENTYYKTLESAIKACPENAGNSQTKIEMLLDVEESVTVEETQNIVLDLNGKTIIGVNESTITNNGKLTISGEDGTITGSGADTITNAGTLVKDTEAKIENTSTEGYYVINNTGIVTINAGIIESDCRGIYNYEDGKVTISGGSLTTEGITIINKGNANEETSPAVKISGNSILESTTNVIDNISATGLIYIDGGIINSTRVGSGAPTVVNEGNGKILITEGTIKCSGKNAVVLNGYNDGNAEGTLEIRGGTIESDTASGVSNREKGNVKISGGIINAKGTGISVSTGTATISGTASITAAGDGITATTGTITMTGGTVTTTGANGIYQTDAGILTISGGSVISTHGCAVRTNASSVTVSGTDTLIQKSGANIGASFHYNGTGRATLSGGTIEVLSDSSSNVIYNGIAGTLKVDGANVTQLGAGNVGTNASTGKIIVNSGILKSNVNNSNNVLYNAYTSGTSSSFGTIEINGGELSTLGQRVIRNSCVYGQIIVTGGTITADGIIDGYGAIYNNVENAVIDVSGGEIKRASCPIYNAQGGRNTTITITGGKVTTTGITAIYNNGAEAKVTIGTPNETSNNAPIITGRIYGEPGVGLITVNSGIIIGTTDQAIFTKESVTVNGGELSTNATEISRYPYTVDAHGKITINGGTITNNIVSAVSMPNANNGGIMEITGGKIESKDSFAINNYGTTNISGTPTIIGGKRGVNVFSGTATITGGTISATGEDGTGVYVTTGTLTLGTNESTPSVSITVPSITGKTAGVYVGTGTFNFYDGIIRGSEGNSILGNVTATPPGYTVMKGTEEIEGITYETSVLSAKYVTEGIVTRLDATNNNGGSHSSNTTTWKALSGTNGTVTNGTWGDNYLEFDGNSSCVNFGEMNNSYQSLEVTFSVDVIKSGIKCVLGNWQTGGGGIAINSNGRIFGEYYINGAYRDVVSNISITTGTIYNVQLTYDGTTFILYVNGTNVKSQDITGTKEIPKNSTVMAIGANPNGDTISGDWFNGKIYTASVYNRALTEEEVKQNTMAGLAVAGGQMPDTIAVENSISDFGLQEMMINDLEIDNNEVDIEQNNLKLEYFEEGTKETDKDTDSSKEESQINDDNKQENADNFEASKDDEKNNIEDSKVYNNIQLNQKNEGTQKGENSEVELHETEKSIEEGDLEVLDKSNILENVCNESKGTPYATMNNLNEDMVQSNNDQGNNDDKELTEEIIKEDIIVEEKISLYINLVKMRLRKNIIC